jgi:hypothetical protein
LHQVHNAEKHRLGRFRISACLDAQETLPLGVAEPLAAILRTPAAQRPEAEVQLINAYVESVDPQIKGDIAAVAAANAPVPKDPAIAAIETKIQRLSVVTPIDPQLERLKVDAEQSEKQLQAERLTAAEDLTWALINSPAFLFNR